jgi:hypothetical protein
MWTKDALHDLIATKLSNYQLIVAANREPYIHRPAGITRGGRLTATPHLLAEEGVA